MNALKIKNATLKLFPVLISFIFLFPILKENLSSFGVILLVLNVILYKFYVKDFSFINLKTLLLTIPFWIILMTSVFTTNLSISLIHIQHSLFFLIIPIAFSLIPIEVFSLKKINLYFKILKNTCLLITIIFVTSYLVDVPLWKFNFGHYNDSHFRDYIYNDFKLFKIHPTYFTSILILCSAHSYEFVLKQKKYLELIYVFVFLAITFLLLTRLNIVILVSTLLLMTLFRSSLQAKHRLFLCLAGQGLVLAFIVFTPGIRTRFAEIANSFNVKPQDVSYDSTNVRKAIFDCDLTLLKENWATGIGFENLQDQLNYCYKSNYDSSFYLDLNYMTHNYYLYIFIGSGILGFILYLIYILNLVQVCVKKNFFLLNLLLINALILCFIEDYFYRQFGVLYFNIVLMLFLRLTKEESNNFI